MGFEGLILGTMMRVRSRMIDGAKFIASDRLDAHFLIMLSKEQVDSIANALLASQRVVKTGGFICPAWHAKAISPHARRRAFWADIRCPSCRAALHLKDAWAIAMMLIGTVVAEVLLIGYLGYQVFYRHQSEPALNVVSWGAVVVTFLIAGMIRRLALVKRS